MTKEDKKEEKQSNGEVSEERDSEIDDSLEEELVDAADKQAEKSSEEFIKELEDQLLRAKAEVQNVRRIAAQEVTKARLYGVESLAKEFLSVGDNIERAIASCEAGEEIAI